MKSRGVPFEKGKVANPDGRPKGARNQKTLAWELIGKKFTDEWANRFMKVMEKTEDKQFLQYYGIFLEYFKPKLNRTEIKGEITIGPKKIGFDDGNDK